MTQSTTHVGRIARRLAVLAVLLLVAATGSAAAHAGSSYGGMMGGSGWAPSGGAMGLWGLLWMGLLVAVPLYAVSSLRERYARGELSDDEFDRRRRQLEHSE